MIKGIDKDVYLIGIGGISMSALAIILLEEGHNVSGSDENKSSITANLEKHGIQVFYKHSATNITKKCTVVFSAAIKSNNEEIVRARHCNYNILSRAELLGKISRKYEKVIAVSGSHGKTTTTAMVSSILIDAGLDPTVHLGGEMNKINGNVRIGGFKEIFVTEACEYFDSFHEIKSDISVILNVQPDHLDYFKNFGNEIKSFKKFAKNTVKDGIIVMNKDDECFDEVAPPNKCVISYSCKTHADYEARRVDKVRNGCYSFDLFEFGVFLGRFHLHIPGYHNIYNALASIAIARQFGISYFELAKSIFNFEGIKRRFEKIGYTSKGAIIYHDYAHHPTEIDAMIKLAKSISKGKVFVIFQPHTYSRTQTLFSDFAKVLATADQVVLYPIYPAREQPIENITSLELSKAVNAIGTASLHLDSFGDIKQYLNSNCQSDDMVLILGAGDIVNLCNLFQ